MWIENQHYTQQPKQQSELQLIDLWHLFWGNKYWFVLSIFICVSVAVIYIASVPNTFTRTASVIIKDAQRNGISELAVFQEMKGMNGVSNIYNEAEAIKSPAMVLEVVNRLKLDVGYFTQRRLYQADLYNQSPIEAQFPSASDKETFSLQVVIKNKEQVELSQFTAGNEELNHSPIVAKLGDTVATPIGRVAILPTLYYEDYLNKQISVFKYTPQVIAKLYSSNLSAKVSDDMTTIINLTLKDVSPRRAEQLLDTLIAVYNRAWISEKNQASNSSINFIDKRLSNISGELNEVELGKKQYKSENRVISADAVGTRVMGKLDRFAETQLVLENDLEMANYLKRFLQDQAKLKELLPAIALGRLSIADQVKDYNALFLKREQLLANSSAENIIVKDLTANLNAVRKAIDKSVDNVIQTTKLELASIKTQEKKADLLLAENPEQERRLISFDREQSVMQQMYVYLMQKKYENELTKTISVSNAKVIAPAQGPLTPIAPKKSMILMIAFTLGLVIPSVILWLIDLLDTTVKGKRDLLALTAPFIGDIPYLRSRAKEDKREKHDRDHAASMVVQEKSRDAVSEAFRIVRSNLDFMGEDRNSKVVLLTSFNAGSGKTFISQNLAMSFALSNKKVIVVDLDLRKATLSKIVPATKQGVSSFLSGRTDELKELIVNSPFHDHLDILPVGAIPPNPAELLLNDRLSLLFEQLNQTYDYIFVDTTPAEIVADASIVGKSADVTLFVVREGLLDKRMLPELERLYQSKKFKNMGVLLNCSHYSSSYYGYRRYGYGYGYGYGY